MTIFHDNVGALADRILEEVGRDIVLGLPLGLGKANHVANELYARAAADRSIRLRIFTALTLDPRTWKSDLERRFVEPLNARLFCGYPRLSYVGAAISDTLDDGRVVSGVGGQYNFVAQAFALDDARSLMTLPATRHIGGRIVSNILWRYGQTTIPRHLRDVVITEYGVADLRGRTDRDCIVAMIGIADARFQDELIREAKAAGKLEKRFEAPARFKENVPERIAEALKPAKVEGHFEAYPFGSDFTEEERRVLPALEWINNSSRWTRARAIFEDFLFPNRDELYRASLTRLALDRPRGLKEYISRAIVLYALSQQKSLQ